MAFFQLRVQNIKFTLSPFSSSSMEVIAQAVRDHIVQRIKDVKDVNDSPARPLTDKYAAQKVAGRNVAMGGPVKYKGLPYRDWTLRGRTLNSIKVKTVSQERAIIGPTMEETAKIIAGRNRKDNMWGLAPSDLAVMRAMVIERLRTQMTITKTGLRKVG